MPVSISRLSSVRLSPFQSTRRISSRLQICVEVPADPARAGLCPPAADPTPFAAQEAGSPVFLVQKTPRELFPRRDDLSHQVRPV